MERKEKGKKILLQASRVLTVGDNTEFCLNLAKLGSSLSFATGFFSSCRHGTECHRRGCWLSPRLRDGCGQLASQFFGPTQAPPVHTPSTAADVPLEGAPPGDKESAPPLRCFSFLPVDCRMCSRHPQPRVRSALSGALPPSFRPKKDLLRSPQ